MPKPSMTVIRARQVLEIEGAIDAAGIKLAYRDLIRVWHPDRFESDIRLRAKAIAKVSDLNDAYRVLTAPGAARAASAAPSSMPDRRRRPRPAPAPPSQRRRTAGIAAAAMAIALVALAGLPLWRSSPSPPLAPPIAAERPLPVEPVPDPPAVRTTVRPATETVRPVSPFSRDLDRALARSAR